MFLKGIVRESFSRVMELTNGIGIMVVIGIHLVLPINMRYLAIKSFCMTIEVI